MCDPLAPDKYAASPPGIITPAFPGVAQSACPGYRFTAVCGQVARTDARHRLRDLSPGFPGGGAKRLPGLRVHRSLRSRSPGKAFTPRPGKNRQKKYLNRTRAP
ncbi:hypothetical protein FMJ68_12875 [Klebsiella grimontii]|nr:hypothetical protein [Klebsiella grimontii]MBZ6950172.1 hypothetical protein [Klebsiella grimontii]MBZ7136427.1 hypothetical protein [Klebsiella grimontii]MBZ7224256.1 hypothetical protein [Klebsiella grimontii]MBZ7378023.1 hypothetical protein [Klebsiella grimontii]